MSVRTPRVTVLMPVYNAEAYLREAIDSILSQTFTDFEFLIIDDGSTDSSADIIRSYDNPRIRFIQNDRNLKLTTTLNKGLDLAHGEYVARMDADDISLPERLAKQVAFMDTHPAVGIVGVWAKAFGEASFLIPHPADAEVCRTKLLFDSCLVHPAVLLRSSFFDTHKLRYRDFPGMEDYELWQRTACLFPLTNIPDYLFRYRVTKGSIFHGGNYSTREQTYRLIDQVSLLYLGIEPTDSELDIHNFLRRPEGSRTAEAEAWLQKLEQSNRKIGYYEAAAFATMLHERWLVVCYQASGSTWKRWWHYASSPITQNAGLPTWVRLRMLGKFLLQRYRST